MSAIDIDRDAAHDAAQRELSKPIYPRGSLTDQLASWLDELIYKIIAGGASVPGGWFTVSVLMILVGAAVFVAVRVARRTMRTHRGRQQVLFGSDDMSSAGHRATAEQCAARGDWASAIRHRLRAVARHLEETAVLNPVPGRTATELARDAGQVIPGLSVELHRAARVFNDVSYGEVPGTPLTYAVVVDLDDHLLAHATQGADDAAPSGPSDDWVEVR